VARTEMKQQQFTILHAQDASQI